MLRITEEELQDRGGSKESLSNYANPTCKKCYGQGYQGVDRFTRDILVCSCVKKQIHKEKPCK